MEKRRSKKLSRLVTVLLIIFAVCIIGYFAFCYWVNASGAMMAEPGQVLGGNNKDVSIDSGSAIVVDGMDRRDGVCTIFVGATDEEEMRTDSMMVLVLDSQNHTVHVINIPRDTLVDTDRTGAGRKVNAAYSQGIDTMLYEVSQIIGFVPDKHVIANFDGIAEIVDAIGGVDFDVPFPMSYHDASQDLSIEFEPGMQHLNGKQVVEYLRWRHNDDGTGYEDGDIGRVAKLQDFLVTIGKEILSPKNILKIPSIASAVTKNVETDITSSQIIWIGMQCMKMDIDENVMMETLYGDPAKVDLGETIWFYILDQDMIVDQINASFNPYTRDLTEDDFHIITPPDLGAYSQSWLDEKEVRYAGYKKQQETDHEYDGIDDFDNTDIDESKENE